MLNLCINRGGNSSRILFSMLLLVVVTGLGVGSVTLLLDNPAYAAEPVADPGPRQTVNEGDLVTLNGTGSYDPDDDAITYRWHQGPLFFPPGGENVDLGVDRKTSGIVTFVAPEVTGRTVFTFTLLVFANGESDLKSTRVTVLNLNQAPVADAGPGQTVSMGAVVTLNGTGSHDPDGSVVTYQWSQLAGIRMSGIYTAQPTFKAPPVTESTDYRFTLRVTDADGASHLDYVTVTVVPNAAPVADAGPDQTVTEGGTVTLDGSGSRDTDGSIDSYRWTTPAGIVLSDADAASPTFAAPYVSSNTDYDFTLRVTDNLGRSAADTVTVTVRNAAPPPPPPPAPRNAAPAADAGPDQTVTEGDLVTLDGSGSRDTDGSIASYRWTAPAGIALSDADAASPTFTAPPVSGSTAYTLTLRVTDNLGRSAADTVTVTVRNAAPPPPPPPAPRNAAPAADAGPDHAVYEGVGITLYGSDSSDPDSDALTYSWTSDSTPPITLSGPSPMFVAPGVASTTDITFTLTVSDGLLTGTDTVVVTVFDAQQQPQQRQPPPTSNRPPAADAGPDQAVYEGVGITLYGSDSSDPDSDALTYSWTSDSTPPITLSGPSPMFVAPGVASTTDITFTLTVSDGLLTGTDTVVVTVFDAQQQPQ